MTIITRIIPDGTLLNVTVRKYPIEGKYILDNYIIENGLLDKTNVVVRVLDHRIYERPEFEGGYWSMLCVRILNTNDTPFTIYSARDIIDFQSQSLNRSSPP